MLDTAKGVQLVRREGPTSIYIRAWITPGGDLRLAGQDIGEAPKRVFGDSDYEYWLTVPSVRKDDLLRALLERQDSAEAFDGVPPSERDAALLSLLQVLYTDDARVDSRLMSLMDEEHIEYKFYSY
jgi:hypothetical protein